MNHTLELLRRHWNYSLGQRLDYLRRTRSQVDRCSIVSEPIGDIPERVNYYTQQSDLKQTKVLFPEYRQIWAESQQVNLQRLNKAWEKWLIPDASGKRGGRPRFKKPGELRSFVYPRINSLKAGAHLSCRAAWCASLDGKPVRRASAFYVGKPDERAPLIGGVLKLSKIGQMKVVVHRPLPDGFVLKTCTIVKKADGWYCCISMQDDSVPSTMPLSEIRSVVGADVGLKEFLTTNEGIAVPIPQFYRKAQGKLARQQRKLARKQKGSRHYLKQQNRIAIIHQQIGRQRQNFHYNTAHDLVKKYDLIAVEDLNIKGLAKSRLSKSILDAAWGAFISILNAVAVKRGVHVLKVNPHGTSQNCSSCGVKVPKTLSVRLHECPKCGLSMDRDENAAVNILNRALSDLRSGGFLQIEQIKTTRWDSSRLRVEASGIPSH